MIREKRYLTNIYIYPIKSLPGVRKEISNVEQRGLQYDRRWMLIDNDRKFISLRENKDLYKFIIKETSKGFDIETLLHKSSLQIPFTYEEGKRIKATIWHDEVWVIEGKQAWNDWFSNVLNISCRLVYLPDDSPRPLNPQWQVNNESVSLADECPYLIVAEASLDNLNAKLEEPIGVERFRPNLVYRGGEAYEEFLLKEFTLGEARFTGLKPCARCMVTTIDPETGHAGFEPLKTLALTNKVEHKIIFGQHALALQFGQVKMGDELEIISWKESPFDPL